MITTKFYIVHTLNSLSCVSFWKRQREVTSGEQQGGPQGTDKRRLSCIVGTSLFCCASESVSLLPCFLSTTSYNAILSTMRHLGTHHSHSLLVKPMLESFLPSSPAVATSSLVPRNSRSRTSAIFTCPNNDGTYYTDQDGNGYQIQCNADIGSHKRDLKHGLHGLGMDCEPVPCVPIVSDTQTDLASCVNSCRTIASCVGTSYVTSSGLCTYFSTFTSVGSDTGTDVAFPTNISCPSLNGFSYLDSSGSEYGIMCNQSYPASSNISSQAGYADLAACSNACSFGASCVASSFVNGQCTFISNLIANHNPGRPLPGAVMLTLLQSRAVDMISATGVISRSTSISIVRDLPSAAAAVQRGRNSHALAASDLLGCGDAFRQPNCAIVAAATSSAVSSFSTVYTPIVAGPVATSNNLEAGMTARPASAPSSKKSPSVDCTFKLLGLIPVGC